MEKISESVLRETIQRVVQEMQNANAADGLGVNSSATSSPAPEPARLTSPPGSSQIQRNHRHSDPAEGCSTWFNNTMPSTSAATIRAIDNNSESNRWQQFGDRYQNAIKSIQTSRRESIAAEQRNNFGKRRRSVNSGVCNRVKQPRLQAWIHRFVCLPKTNHNRVPSAIVERNAIIQAGLWEKRITIPNIDCGAKEFNDIILEAFPKLNQGGGFELLRCCQSSKSLETIPYQISHSPRLLKQSIGSAKIYIRPIQADLNLSPLSDDEDEEA